MKRVSVLLLLLFIMLSKANSQNSSPPLKAGEERFSNRPKLIRGPYLQVATDTSMVIRWRTDVLSRSRVRYGASPDQLARTVDSVEYTTEHELKITGLTPGTKYYYSIGTLKDTLQYGPNNSFSTLPGRGKEGVYRVGIFGDCGYLSINQASVRDQFIKYIGTNDINAWLLLGDNAYNDGNDMEYQSKFFTPFKDILLKKYPVFPSPGNHDYHDADFTAERGQKTHEVPYYQNFSMPVNGEAGGVPSHNPAFYSFDLGNIHFISLDSYGMEEQQYFLWDTTGPQVQWLKKDLAANRNTGWVVVFFHHPPYSKGTHDSDTDDTMKGIRENLLRILERYQVDLVIAGHSHVYERSKLLKGHYGTAKTFDAAKYNVSNSSGLYNGTPNGAPYIKEQGPNKGIVYVVSGTSAYVGKAYPDWPHPAMYYSNDSAAGSGILEVRENRLDFKWICGDGVIRDQFTMMKNVNRKNIIQCRKGETVTLKASFVADSYKWDKDGRNTRSIEVTPKPGKTKYVVKDPYNYLEDTFEVVVSK